MAKEKKPDFTHAMTAKEAEARRITDRPLNIRSEAVLDDPEKYLSWGSASTGKSTPAAELPLYEHYGPVSGDDLAKMRGKRLGLNPDSEDHGESVYSDYMGNGAHEYYVVKAPQNRAHDKSRRPGV